MGPTHLTAILIDPMVSGITICVDDPGKASADDLPGFCPATSAQNSENRHLRCGINPEPFLFDAFRPSGLIHMIDRLLMNILLGRLNRLIECLGHLLLNCRDASKTQLQASQSLHRLDYVSVAESQPAGHITDHSLRPGPETPTRHLCRPLGFGHLATG